jgi:hypothetical protein
MPKAVIRSNRAEVSGRFPLLGFTVRTGANPFFEVAMATDPTLFTDKARRTANNFYSTRALGPLPADGDESIYLVPDEVLRRFVGQERIYYAIATFADRTRAKADVAVIAPDAAPFVSISRSFTGRMLRQTVGAGAVTGGSTGAYGSQNGASLEWAGDAPRPGAEPASPSKETTSPSGKSTAPAQATALEHDATYDDGYSRDLWDQDRPTGRPYGGSRRVSAMSAQSFDIGWADVPMVAEGNGLTCWAAAASMVVGWRDNLPIDLPQITNGAGPWAKFSGGLNVVDVLQLAAAYGLDAETAQPYTIDAFRQLVETRGPLWVAAHAPGPHAIVVTGIYGDGTADGTYVRINDPLGHVTAPVPLAAYNPTPGQGSQYVLTYRQFAAEFGTAATLPQADVQIVHVKERDMAGRTPMVTSQAFALWQSAETRRSSRSLAAPVVVPIVTAIAGTVMTRVLNNEGDIKWELDQLQGLKHPGNNATNAGSASYQTATTPVASWPYVENLIGDRISADFEMQWQYNGTSLGNIVISNTNTNDAVGWGLDVKCNINDDANVYDGKAAVRVRFHYRFNRSIGSDIIAITDYTLFADGKYTRTSRWTQGGPEAQSLAYHGNGGGAPSRAMVAPVVVPIVAAVVGATFTRILGNEGDIKWELDQMRGMKYVGDDKTNAGPLSPTWVTIPVEDWPVITNGFDDAIYADFEIKYQYDGRSVGNVMITNTHTNDAVAWGLTVKAVIMDDAAAYTRPGAAASFAAVKVQFYYRFDRIIRSDRIAITDFTLYGDGTYSKSSRWTQ